MIFDRICNEYLLPIDNSDSIVRCSCESETATDRHRGFLSGRGWERWCLYVWHHCSATNNGCRRPSAGFPGFARLSPCATGFLFLSLLFPSLLSVLFLSSSHPYYLTSTLSLSHSLYAFVSGRHSVIGGLSVYVCVYVMCDVLCICIFSCVFNVSVDCVVYVRVKFSCVLFGVK